MQRGETREILMPMDALTWTPRGLVGAGFERSGLVRLSSNADPSWTLDLLQPRVVHGGRMKCRHKPNQVSSKHIMNCFQHIPESCGALHSPCGGAPQQRGALTPQTQTRPNRLHTHTHPPKHIAHLRSPIPHLSGFILKSKENRGFSVVERNRPP